MLWLCLYLPELPLEALTPTSGPCAVIEQAASRRWLLRLDAAAGARGLHPGMTFAAALTLVPELKLLSRDAVREREAIEAVACWAYALGRPITFDMEASAVWCEIGASLKLFGGGAGLWRRITERAEDLSLVRRFGIAPTLRASLLMAQCDAGFSRPILKRNAIPAGIGLLPLSALNLPGSVMATLQGSGLRSLGELIRIPAAALNRRFGTDLSVCIDQLLGRRPQLYAVYEPPSSYRRRFECLGGLESTEQLLFPLRGMLADFCNYLRARDVAVQHFRLRFTDDGRRRSKLDIALLKPSRDPARLMLVLRERLERIALAEPLIELVLEADRFESTTAVTEDLFEGGSGDGERFEGLRERFVARLGRDAVRSLWATPDPRPEKAWSLQAEDAPAQAPARPLWLLPMPQPIPSSGEQLSPPERIESGWWERGGARRDYYLAREAGGRKLWVYREPGSEQWWLHGLWQ